MTIKTFLSYGVSGVDEYKAAVKSGRIDEVRSESSTKTIDNITTRKNGEYYVTPFAITKSQYLIICPHCGGIHAHGRQNGHRVSHCRNGRGYIIEADI